MIDLRQAVQAAIISMTVACGNTSTGPQSTEDPGFVRVSITGPLLPDVAFKIRLTGGMIDSVRVPGGTLYFETLAPTLHRAIVIDSPDRTRLLEFWLPDRTLVDSIGINIEEIAAANTYEQRSVAGYVATIGK